MAKKQSNKKSNKAGNKVSVTTSQIKVLLKAIEDMKDKIIEVWADETLAVAEKNAKLEAMGNALHATEKYTLQLVGVAVGGNSASAA